MTDTDPTPAASKPNGRKKQNAAATEQLPEAPSSTTIIAPAAAPTPAAPARTGVGRGILIGAIAASLIGGLAIGGGAGALIATAASHHRPDFSQAGPFGQGGPQQNWQQGPGQGFGQGAPQGGMPGMPGEQTQPGQPGQLPGQQTQPGQPQQGQDDDGQTSQDGSTQQGDTGSDDGSN